MAATIELLDGFLDVHEAQLRQMRFPAALHARLYEKLRGEVFDAGDAFTFQFDEAIAEQNSSGDQAPRCPLSLLAQRCIAAESDVWLVDHVWLFSTAASALAQLQDDEGLRARLAALFSIEDSRRRRRRHALPGPMHESPDQTVLRRRGGGRWKPASRSVAPPLRHG